MFTFALNSLILLPGISVAAPIHRSTPWAFTRKNFPFVPTIEMSTLFAFPAKNQLNAQGAVTENPGMQLNYITILTDLKPDLCTCRMSELVL